MLFDTHENDRDQFTHKKALANWTNSNENTNHNKSTEHTLNIQLILDAENQIKDHHKRFDLVSQLSGISLVNELSVTYRFGFSGV